MTTIVAAEGLGADHAPAGGTDAANTGIPGRTDECLGPDGTDRTRWNQVEVELAALGPDGLLARRNEPARIIRNEGATDNVGATFGAGGNPGRSTRVPWWSTGASGRRSSPPWPNGVSLLGAIVADIYGDRRLVTP